MSTNSWHKNINKQLTQMQMTRQQLSSKLIVGWIIRHHLKEWRRIFYDYYYQTELRWNKRKSFLSLNWLLEERKKRIWRNRCCHTKRAICLHHHRHLLLHQREEESTHHLSLHCLIILWNFPFGLIWLISIRTCIFLSHHHYFHVVSFSHKKNYPPTNKQSFKNCTVSNDILNRS